MFATHTAQIAIERVEPVGLDVAYARAKVAKRHEEIAEKAVMLATINTRPTNKTSAYEKILKAWEFDERLKPLQEFIEAWNRWRDFYANPDRPYFGEWEPKTSSQISAIETVLDVIEEHNLDLDYFVACGHKAYAWSKYPLTLSQLVAHGLDYFARHFEDVKVDLAEEEYRHTASSSDRWEAESDD